MTTQLGARIQDARLKRGWSVLRVAQVADLNDSWLGKLERGQVKRPGREMLTRVAQALDLDAHELLVLAGWERPETDRSVNESLAELRRILYSDVHLTYEQAGALVTLYEYFTRAGEP